MLSPGDASTANCRSTVRQSVPLVRVRTNLKHNFPNSQKKKFSFYPKITPHIDRQVHFFPQKNIQTL